ncbi:hypothetical protein CANCADRAFT_4103 [Tortispora caseinolytica NRRL Y-17796]|uniref:Guanine nucleotide-exchange factor SEC12 n=1 Tax=Tortispora caseinolytica NRRL Y-17796 TaxID=767744 RepID=A0A1E4TCJ1_9ASCO|nr:hypothetical protein CANCADRAFT_4103 [Tortispora caseinolytica NRRL Y-17796]
MYKAALDCPVFDACFATENEFLVVGGGGPGGHGVPNSITAMKFDETLAPAFSYKLEGNTQAPSSVDVSRSGLLALGCTREASDDGEASNDYDGHLKLFDYDLRAKSIQFSKSVNVFPAAESEDDLYQRFTKFGANDQLLAVGSSLGDIAILDADTLKVVFTKKLPARLESMDFKGLSVVACTESNLYVWNLSEKLKSYDADYDTDTEGDLDEEVADAIESAAVSIATKGVNDVARRRLQRVSSISRSTAIETHHSYSVTITTPDRFRCVAFSDAEMVYAAINISPRKGAYIVSYSIDSESPTLKMTATQSLKTTAVTALAASSKYVAVGNADYSITLLDLNLKALKSIKMAHTFSITSLNFSPSGTHLVSTSVDATVAYTKLHAAYSTSSY